MAVFLIIVVYVMSTTVFKSSERTNNFVFDAVVRGSLFRYDVISGDRTINL